MDLADLYTGLPSLLLLGYQSQIQIGLLLASHSNHKSRLTYCLLCIAIQKARNIIIRKRYFIQGAF